MGPSFARSCTGIRACLLAAERSNVPERLMQTRYAGRAGPGGARWDGTRGHARRVEKGIKGASKLTVPLLASGSPTVHRVRGRSATWRSRCAQLVNEHHYTSGQRPVCHHILHCHRRRCRLPPVCLRCPSVSAAPLKVRPYSRANSPTIVQCRSFDALSSPTREHTHSRFWL